MKKSYFLLFILALFLSSVANLSFAADTKNLYFPARVKVTVKADDDIKNTVISYVNRELRSLNYVELVSNEPQWDITILVLKPNKTGVILSAAITHHVENFLLSNILKPEYKDDDLASNLLWANETSNLLYTGPIDDLREFCTNIVATFDTQFEEGRKLWLRIAESQKKGKRAK